MWNSPGAACASQNLFSFISVVSSSELEFGRSPQTDLKMLRGSSYRLSPASLTKWLIRTNKNEIMRRQLLVLVHWAPQTHQNLSFNHTEPDWSKEVTFWCCCLSVAASWLVSDIKAEIRSYFLFNEYVSVSSHVVYFASSQPSRCASLLSSH